MHTDGYAAYNVLNPKARQACIAHLIRNAKEIKQTILIKRKKNQDENSIAFCDNIITFFKKACKIAHKFLNGKIPREKAGIYNRILYSRIDSICAKKLDDKKTETFKQRLLNPKKE